MSSLPVSRTVASAVAGLAIAVLVIGGVAYARSAGSDTADPALTSSADQRQAVTVATDGADPLKQLKHEKRRKAHPAQPATQVASSDAGDAVVAQVASSGSSGGSAQTASKPAKATASAGDDDGADVASLDAVAHEDDDAQAEPEDHAGDQHQAEDHGSEDHGDEGGE